MSSNEDFKQVVEEFEKSILNGLDKKPEFPIYTGFEKEISKYLEEDKRRYTYPKHIVNPPYPDDKVIHVLKIDCNCGYNHMVHYIMNQNDYNPFYSDEGGMLNSINQYYNQIFCCGCGKCWRFATENESKIFKIDSIKGGA